MGRDKLSKTDTEFYFVSKNDGVKMAQTAQHKKR